MFKICSHCNQEKLLSGFRRDKTHRCGYHPWCKLCAREYHKSAYVEKYGEKARIRNSIRAKEMREKIAEYKKTHPCEVCGETERVCLDFHHLDPNKKDFGISTYSGTRGWKTIQEEIEKCVVLCKNCHAKVHAGILKVPRQL